MSDKNNVVNFPASSNMTPEQALGSALNYEAAEGLTDVLILGYNTDGNLFIRSSKMTNKDALWLLEAAKMNTILGE